MDLNKQDVNLAHRVPTRQATTGSRPVTCKFTRRIVKEEVINLRKVARKVSATKDCSTSLMFSGRFSRFSITSFDRRRNYSPIPRNGPGSTGQELLLSICCLRTPVPSGSKARKTLIDLHAKSYTCL